ncbi:hypothetical protein B0I37DRAFT_363671 [Chaetomium sp. MPI-CAGE-AT-0009]|nr:hypothetical protein B0I37DRAFT_363671 [Chaetomium sp. MPI-CAGE-AT-0009]
MATKKWASYRKAMADGTFRELEVRIPVILNPDGPISSAEELQRVAETESVPEVLQTTLTTREGRARTTKPVTICHVNYDERERLEERADVEYNMTGKFVVMFRGQERCPMMVRSLKAGVDVRGPARNNGAGLGNGKMTQ